MLLLFSSSVMSNSLQSHRLQHARLLYPSPSHRVCSNSCPLSQWCHPTISSISSISSSVIPFSFYPQSSLASGSFPVSQLFTSGGQDIGALASVLTMNIQGWFPLGLILGLISLLSQESPPAPQFKSINSSVLSLLSHPYITTHKTITLTMIGRMVSQRYPCPNSWNLWICIILHSEKEFANVIEVTDLKTGKVAWIIQVCWL